MHAIGIAWYARDTYLQTKAAMDDGHVLPDTFDEWERKAQQIRKQYLAQGVMVVPANIELDAFTTWCRANGRNLDAQGRMDYANFIAYTTYNKTK